MLSIHPVFPVRCIRGRVVCIELLDAVHESRQTRNLSHARRFAEEGAYCKAAQSVDSDRFTGATSDVKEILATKDPQTPPEYEHEISISDADRMAVEPIIAEEVLTAIKKFSQCSEGGGFGLTFTAIRELIGTLGVHEDGGLIHTLSSLFTKRLKRKAPASLKLWIAGAPINPLRKPNNDLRSIYVGETLLRLSGSILLAGNVEDIVKHFEPHQLGFSIRHGTEVATHAVRAFVQEHTEPG